MLLIPNAIHTILEKGRREGREEGQQKLLDRLVNEAVITEERRNQIEADPRYN